MIVWTYPVLSAYFDQPADIWLTDIDFIKAFALKVRLSRIPDTVRPIHEKRYVRLSIPSAIFAREKLSPIFCNLLKLSAASSILRPFFSLSRDLILLPIPFSNWLLSNCISTIRLSILVLKPSRPPSMLHLRALRTSVSLQDLYNRFPLRNHHSLCHDRIAISPQC